MLSFLWALTGCKPSVGPGTFGSGQTGCTIFPEHGVQDSFWFNTEGSSGGGGWGGWHSPKPMAVPLKPQKELCDCGGRFWRNPPTQCPPLFINMQQKQKSLLQSAVTHTRKLTQTHTHIHKQSLNLNSLPTSATLASVWSHNEFPIKQSLNLYQTSSCHSLKDHYGLFSASNKVIMFLPDNRPPK